MKSIHLMTVSALAAAGLLTTACANGDQTADADTSATEQSTAAYEPDASTTATGTESAAATAPDTSMTTAADFTGQAVYDESGVEVGTVAGVGTASATGEEVAIVQVGNYLGMGAKNIAIPASELSARAAGGLTVSMTSDEIEASPEYTGALPAPTTDSPDAMTDGMTPDPVEPMEDPQPQQ